MKKKLFVLFMMLTLVMAFSICGCGNSADTSSDQSAEATSEAASGEADTPDADAGSSAEDAEAPAVDATAYGYGGDDPVEAAAYKYMAEEMSKGYDKADASIPTVNIVNVDYTNEDEVLAYGDFWIENYNIEGDTLKSVSGGNYPGVMHLAKDGEGYEVTKLDVVEDGADFDSSAKELFGDNYDAFMKVNSDSDARNELRRVTITDYVHYNNLPVTQYQDEGWDPVELYQ